MPSVVYVTYLKYLNIFLNALIDFSRIALYMLCKTLLELHGMTSKDHSITGLVVVNTDDPKSRVLKQMLVRGQYIKVHQGAFDLSVCQSLADLLVSLVAMLLERIKNRFINLELSSMPKSIAQELNFTWASLRGFPQHENTKFGFIF